MTVFSAENKEKPDESMVGACRVESTGQFTAGRFHHSLMDQHPGLSMKS